MKNIVFVIVLILLTSCVDSHQSETQPSPIQIIKISEDDLLQHGNLSDLIADFVLVPLETDSSCLIMEIKKVIFHKDHYYVFDESAQNILKFNATGKFIKKIGKSGEGPGEFFEIHDFTIDSEKDILYVPDYYKLHLFRLDGLFIKSLPLEFMGPEMVRIKENDFIFAGGFEDFRIRLADSLGNLVSSYIPYSKINSASSKYPLTSVDTNVYFHLPACDTIFQIKNGKPEPAYFIDFGDKAFNREYFDNLPRQIQNDMGNYLNNETDRITFFSFLPNKKHIFLQLDHAKNYYSGYYDKRTKKHLFVNHNKYKNDLFGSFFYFNPVGIMDDRYIIEVPSYKFLENQDATLLSTPENQKIINRLNKYSNPVLMIVTPKTIH